MSDQWKVVKCDLGTMWYCHPNIWKQFCEKEKEMVTVEYVVYAKIKTGEDENGKEIREERRIAFASLNDTEALFDEIPSEEDLKHRHHDELTQAGVKSFTKDVRVVIRPFVKA